MTITKQTLIDIDSAVTKSQLDLDALVDSLNNHLTVKTNMGTVRRQAAFLAQTCFESQHFQRLIENLNYSGKALKVVFPRYFPDDTIANAYANQPEKIANLVYANQLGNGDSTSGDGWKFRGRGLIQLTGQWNYLHCGPAIGQDLIAHPEYLESIECAVSSSIWFWNFKNINSFVDIGDFAGVTKMINPASLGAMGRSQLYQNALKVLK